MSPVEDHTLAIDEIDDEIITLLARRFGHSRQIGEIKRGLGQAPYDPQRMRDQHARFVEDCMRQGLDEGMARQLIAMIAAQVLVERLETYRSGAPGEAQ